MKIRVKSNKSKRVSENGVPNVLAFGFIRGFLTEKEYKDMREEYFIGNLDKTQVSQVMTDIKWLFKSYKGLNVMTIEDEKGDITKFIL